MFNKIDILLAVYNGEKYITSQLYSLLAQTHQDWHLYVADDGSTDKTLEIIQEIMQGDSRLTIVDFSEPIKNAGKNFWRLLPHSTADYIICCDQDDIWLEKKLEILLHHAQKWQNPNTPNLVWCDAYAYDSKSAKITADTIYQFPFFTLEDFIFHNGGYQGSSILFNKSLKNKAIQFQQDFYIHDEILTLLAYCFGEVIAVKTPLMLYRLHDNNVIGMSDNSNVLVKRFKQLLFRNSFVIYKPSYHAKLAFYKFYKAELPPKATKNFQLYTAYCQSNFIKRCLIAIKGKPTKFRLYFIYRTLTKKLFNE